MAYITLLEAKDHLRVDFEEDDIYITQLIDVAEQTISNEIGTTLASNEVGGVLPAPLKHAILLLVGHLYASREPVAYGTTVVEIPLTLTYLLATYKTWVCK